jgi:hypothetical protein
MLSPGKSVLFRAVFILHVIALPLEAGEGYGSFKNFYSLFDFPGVREAMTELEKREYARIRSVKGLPSYDGRLIRLYLLASEVTSTEELQAYMDRFDSMLAEIRRKTKNLSRYHRAEYTLHYLHDNLFRVRMKGKGAGYNIGIRRTFDEGHFNCYKSALIYNAMLDEMGIKTGYVSVPGHIFTIVYIDGKKVEVETTNRYGFDTRDLLSGTYGRRLHRSDVRVDVPSYRSRQPLDNLRVLVQVYNNRSLVYTADVHYPDFDPSRNYGRAVVLSLLGCYLSHDRDRYIIDNTLYKSYQLVKNRVMDDTGLLEEKVTRLKRLYDSKPFDRYADSHRQNIEVLVAKVITLMINRETRGTSAWDPSHAEKLHQISLRARSLLDSGSSALETIYNNVLAGYISKLLSDHRSTSREDIKKLYSAIDRLLGEDVFRGSRSAEKVRNRVHTNILIEYMNLGSRLYNMGKQEEALEALNAGVRFASSHSGYRESVYFRLKSNRDRLARQLGVTSSGR